MGTEALIALAAVSVAASLAGTGVAVAGAKQQAQAADDTAKFNAKIAENDAIAAQQEAVLEAEQVRRKNRLLTGAQRAGYGKAGVDLSAGNDVIFDSGKQGELEALSVLYAGDRAASYNQSRATASRFQGANAQAAGRYAVAGSLIGGLASTAGTISNAPSFRRPASNYSSGGRVNPRYGQS